MRAPRRVAAAVGAIILTILLPGVVPAAGADPAAPWIGTYAGSGKGKAVKGSKEVTAAVTVWLEDAGGGNAKVTFRIDKYGLTLDATGEVEPQSNGSYLIPFDVSSTTVNANGVLTVTRQGEKMVMSGDGAGKALGKEGTGSMGAEQTSSGVVLPSLGQQTKDMISGIFGGPDKARRAPAPAVTKSVTKAKPVSSLAPARPSAPIATERQIFAMVLLFLIFMFLVFVPVWSGGFTDLKSRHLTVFASQEAHADAGSGEES